MIACRYPIKPCHWMFRSVLIGYLALILTVLYLIEPLWGRLLGGAITVLSAYYCILQYRAEESFGEELCWTGTDWMVDCGDGKHNYLALDCGSWVTPYFCLLKFNCGQQDKVWLFCRGSLGDRLFRQLCFQIKQALIQTSA